VQKRYAWPKGHWDWPIKVTHKHGVRSDQMIWVGGQVDLTSSGTVLNAGDLATQTQNCMANFGRVVEELDASLVDLVKLLCFYVNDGTVDEQMFLETVGQALPEGARPAVTAVPVPYLAYPGMQVEIEGYAMLGEDHARLPRSYAVLPDVPALPTSFAQGVRCGRMIFISAQSPVDGDGSVAFPGDIVAQTKQVMVQIGRALGSFGASYDDVVKINRWYVGHGTIADFESAALACAAYFKEPGPAATGVPIPRHARDGQQIKIEVVAMLGEDDRPLPRRHAWPESLWDWHVHLPYKHGLKCDSMIFLGGQVSLDKQGRAVHPNKLAAQTRQAMTHIGTILRELGASYHDVCKVTTVYQGSCGEDDLHENLSIRSSFFADPGPATTGIPLPTLAYPGMVIEIDVFAMAAADGSCES
jgi:enamine deaminase RidA (YjgF/YER057c/UK114 family)